MWAAHQAAHRRNRLTIQSDDLNVVMTVAAQFSERVRGFPVGEAGHDQEVHGFICHIPPTLTLSSTARAAVNTSTTAFFARILHLRPKHVRHLREHLPSGVEDSESVGGMWQIKPCTSWSCP